MYNLNCTLTLGYANPAWNNRAPAVYDILYVLSPYELVLYSINHCQVRLVRFETFKQMKHRFCIITSQPTTSVSSKRTPTRPQRLSSSRQVYNKNNFYNI
jgi:hypothetical protein